MRSRPAPPNILLIMTDQHRWDYLGCAGADFVDTPHIDSLAASGARFAQAFTTAPVCAASRISLATGLHPLRTGCLDNDNILPRQAPTYYQILRDRGYHVGCVGKLDLEKTDPYNGIRGDRPQTFRWGFTHPVECEGKMHAAAATMERPLGPYTQFLKTRGLLDQFREDYQKRAEAGWTVGAAQDSVLPADAFEDAFIGRRAARWIDEIPDDFPWHLFVSFVGPHDPFDPPREYAERFRDRPMPPAIESDAATKPGWIRARMKAADGDELARVRRQYCALIKLIDDQVGLLLDALERRSMRENTVIVFTSDHGEMLGDHGLWQKRVPYEPSIRIPLIVSGPGCRPAVSDAMIELSDLNPTICELAGAAPAPDIDARSFAPLLAGARSHHRDAIATAMPNFRCARTATHKFVEHDEDRAELYSLTNDPAERHNIIQEEPALGGGMADMLRARFP